MPVATIVTIVAIHCNNSFLQELRAQVRNERVQKEKELLERKLTGLRVRKLLPACQLLNGYCMDSPAVLVVVVISKAFVFYSTIRDRSIVFPRVSWHES